VADELKDSAPSNPIRGPGARQGVGGKKCGRGSGCIQPAIAYNQETTGRGAVWLARLNGVQEVAGSNPVAPTSQASL
jgi:hypothetical protein